MNIDTKTEKININQLINKRQENIDVESDVIIPDVKPDVLKIINTNANICIYKKEIVDEKIKIDGSLNANIIYLADDSGGSISAMNTNIDFTKVIDVKGAKADMMLECSSIINTIECKIINGRKISIRSNLTFELKVFSNHEVDLVQSIENIEDLQMLKTSSKVNSLMGHGTTKSIAKETVNIDENDSLVEIMKVDLDICNIEKKISYNKVLTKADINFNLLYLTEENSVKSVKCKIPIMGFIDIQNVSDENFCDIKMELKNLIVKPNNMEEHSIYLEAEFEFGCFAYETKDIELIEDMYCPCIDLKSNSKKINVLHGIYSVNEMCSIREKQVIPEISKGNIYDIDVKPCIRKKNILNEKAIIDGEVKVKIIYQIENRIEMKEIIIPFTHNIDNVNIDSKCDLDVNFEVGDKNIVIMPDESLDIKIELVVLVNVVKNDEINIISDIEVNEKEKNDEYSVVIYFAKPGDTLWKIAKKFKSTVEDIAKLNNLEDENKISVGEQLFIPKYVSRKKIDNIL